MRNRLPKKYYLIPALYVVLIIVFLHLHLNESGGRYITQNIGPVTVRYRQEGGMRKGVSRLVLNVAGMTADLSAGVPVEDPGGRSDLIGIKEVDFENDLLRLVLNRGGSIEFARDFSLSGGIHSVENGGNISDTGFAVMYRPDSESTDDFRPVLQLSLPAGTGSLDVSRPVPLIRMEMKDQDFLIAYNHNVFPEDQQLTVKFNRPATPGFFHEVNERAALDSEGVDERDLVPGMVVEPVRLEDSLSYWFFGKGTPPSDQEVNGALVRKQQSMMAFWRRGGNAEAGEVVSAMAAHSLRTSGRTALDIPAGLSDSALQEGSWQAAPFVGNIVQAEQRYSTEERQLVRGLADLTSATLLRFLSDSVKTTDYPSIISRLVFAGEEALSPDYESLLLDILENRLDNSTAAAGLFELVVNGSVYFPEQFGFMDELIEKSYRQVLPHIFQRDSRLMYRAYSDADPAARAVTAVNPFVQLRVARALQMYSTVRNDELAGALGNSLLMSVMSSMDSNGSLPAEIIFEGDTVQPTDSMLSPAEVYPFMSDNNYYPRVVSLQRELGSDVRLWTGARAVGAVQRTDGFEITFDFAAGETEFIVMRGIEPFASLEMYGMTWNGDWRFQNYDVGGWFYDRQRRVLYIKLRHTERVERIRILTN